MAQKGRKEASPFHHRPDFPRYSYDEPVTAALDAGPIFRHPSLAAGTRTKRHTHHRGRHLTRRGHTAPNTLGAVGKGGEIRSRRPQSAAPPAVSVDDGRSRPRSAVRSVESSATFQPGTVADARPDGRAAAFKRRRSRKQTLRHTRNVAETKRPNERAYDITRCATVAHLRPRPRSCTATGAY